MVVFFSLSQGRVNIPFVQTMKILFSAILPMDPDWSTTTCSVILDVRLPRILAGIFVGAALSISGASFQGVFQNPLVSPHILGVASGAGFGAALAILLFDNIWIIHLVSFLFGLISVGLTYTLSRVYKITPILMLVLSGIVVGSLFSALTSFLKYIADPMNKMPAIVFWLLGSLNHVSFKNILITAPVFMICITILLLVRWRINLLAMGEEDAKALGVNTEVLKALIIVSATIARTALATEIPIGILTAIFGAPVFAFLLRKSQKRA